jgi:hypothetical protein
MSGDYVIPPLTLDSPIVFNLAPGQFSRNVRLPASSEERFIVISNTRGEVVTSEEGALAIQDALGLHLVTLQPLETVLLFGGAVQWRWILGSGASSTSVGVREMMASPRVYFIRPDGHDANDGLANTAAKAFRTPQRFIDKVLHELDTNGYSVTGNLEGNFATGIHASGPVVGGGAVIITTSSAASITTVDVDCIHATKGADLKVMGNITLGTIGIPYPQSRAACVSAWSLGKIEVGAGVTFGMCAGPQITAGYVRSSETDATVPSNLAGPGIITISGNYNITGPTYIGPAPPGTYVSVHMTARGSGSHINVNSGVIATLIGVPHFEYWYANCSSGSIYFMDGTGFIGTGTGSKYQVASGGSITVPGGGIDWLPGNSVGFEWTGGVYSWGGFVGRSRETFEFWLGQLEEEPPIEPGWMISWFSAEYGRLSDKHPDGSIGTTVVANEDPGVTPRQFVTGVTEHGRVTKASVSGADIGLPLAFAGGVVSGQAFSAMGSGLGDAGFLTLQGGTTPAIPAATRARLFTDATGRLSWIRGDGFIRTLDSVLTGNRVYTLPDENAVLAGLTEGTFAPVLLFGGVGGATATVSGFWHKIGHMMCHVLFNIQLSNKGVATGVATIGGLPFAPTQLGVGDMNANNMAASVVTQVTGTATPVGPAINVQKMSAGIQSALTDVDFTNTSVLRGNFLYKIN